MDKSRRQKMADGDWIGTSVQRGYFRVQWSNTD